MLLAIGLAIERHVTIGRKPAARKVDSSKCGSRRSTLNVQPLSFATIGSGTITTAALSFPATNATRYGSPFTALKANSIGSSFFEESPHCSGVLPAHITIPSFPRLTPSTMGDGFSCVTGQLTAVYSTLEGNPET